MSNFLLDSDNPVDKVIYQHQTSVSLAAGPGTIQDVVIPHLLGFLPLVSAQWSLTSDFSTAYNVGGGPRTGGTLLYGAAVSSDSTYVYLNTVNNTASSVTIYFKIFGLMPSNVNADVTPTAILGENFVLNTTQNYTKLKLAGILTGPSSGTSTQTIAHGLSYIPQMSAWITRANKTAPVIVNYYESSPFDTVVCSVDATNFSVTFNSQMNAKDVHYRIYEDKQTV